MWIQGTALILSALGLVCCVLTEDEQPAKKTDGYIKVEIRGKLQTGVVAIGGETTGTLVHTRDGTLELDLGKDQKLREAAEQLNDKTVLVTGKLTIRRGVEIRQRLIVTVATLKEAPAEEGK
jgi:hypothetical protein